MMRRTMKMMRRWMTMRSWGQNLKSEQQKHQSPQPWKKLKLPHNQRLLAIISICVTIVITPVTRGICCHVTWSRIPKNVLTSVVSVKEVSRRSPHFRTMSTLTLASGLTVASTVMLRLQHQENWYVTFDTATPMKNLIGVLSAITLPLNCRNWRDIRDVILVNGHINVLTALMHPRTLTSWRGICESIPEKSPTNVTSVKRGLHRAILWKLTSWSTQEINLCSSANCVLRLVVGRLI